MWFKCPLEVRLFQPGIQDGRKLLLENETSILYNKAVIKRKPLVFLGYLCHKYITLSKGYEDTKRGLRPYLDNMGWLSIFVVAEWFDGARAYCAERLEGA